jgi:hypothetical protein
MKTLVFETLCRFSARWPGLQSAAAGRPAAASHRETQARLTLLPDRQNR